MQQKRNNNPRTQTTPEPKAKDSLDLENLQKVIKRLTDEIIDGKRNSGEGPSNKRPYRPFLRRPKPPRAP